jgi:hypothetical protein
LNCWRWERQEFTSGKLHTLPLKVVQIGCLEKALHLKRDCGYPVSHHFGFSLREKWGSKFIG